MFHDQMTRKTDQCCICLKTFFEIICTGTADHLIARSEQKNPCNYAYLSSFQGSGHFLIKKDNFRLKTVFLL